MTGRSITTLWLALLIVEYGCSSSFFSGSGMSKWNRTESIEDKKNDAVKFCFGWSHQGGFINAFVHDAAFSPIFMLLSKNRYSTLEWSWLRVEERWTLLFVSPPLTNTLDLKWRAWQQDRTFKSVSSSWFANGKNSISYSRWWQNDSASNVGEENSSTNEKSSQRFTLHRPRIDVENRTVLRQTCISRILIQSSEDLLVHNCVQVTLERCHQATSSQKQDAMDDYEESERAAKKRREQFICIVKRQHMSKETIWFHTQTKNERRWRRKYTQRIGECS